MKVLIGTKNQGKIEGAKRAFERYFNDVEIIGVPVDSEVGDEPLDIEICLGARNRVKNLKKYAKENKIPVDYYIAVESGITNSLGAYMIINVAVIEDSNEIESVGTAPGFPVPDKYVDEVINTDLGTVMDRIFNEKNLNIGKGGISFLTHNVISRIDLTEQAFIMALVKFINDDIWK